MQRALLHALVAVLFPGLVTVSVPVGAATIPTFTKDIAPILYNSCLSCHRPGEIAPMSLLTYQDARPWAKAIRSKVVSREMPPWGADPRFGTWKDDRSLSREQVDTIVRWVDGGAPKGNDADLPTPPVFATGWSRGEPDVVIEMPVDFQVPSESEVPVIDFFVKAPFDHDVFVKALEVRPGTPRVVHHAGVYMIDKLPDGARLENGRIVGADGKPLSRNQVARANGGTSTREIQKLLSYVPGRGYEEYQGDAGQLIKAGSYIDFYMHYTPTGEPQKDRSRLGLYFARPGQRVARQIFHSFGSAGPTAYIVEGTEYTPERRRVDAPGATDRDEGSVNLPNIPPYAENWKVVGVHAIRESITLYGLTPHLHLRGKSMKYTVTLPDGLGKFIRTWGKLGSSPGEFRTPHSVAFDSRGRLFVADRGNLRLQIFDQDGKFLEEWKQFSRLSGIYIDKNDVLYGADSESNTPNHPGWKRGTRIGSAKDGTVRYFIPDPQQNPTSTSAAEGVAVAAEGNVYGAEVGPKALKKYVKKSAA